MRSTSEGALLDLTSLFGLVVMWSMAFIFIDALCLKKLGKIYGPTWPMTKMARFVTPPGFGILGLLIYYLGRSHK